MATSTELSLLIKLYDLYEFVFILQDLDYFVERCGFNISILFFEVFINLFVDFPEVFA